MTVLWGILLVLLVGIVPIIVCSVLSWRASTYASALAATSIAHALGGALLLGSLLLVVPRFRSVFADFGVPLPTATVWVIELSGVSVRFSLVLVPVALILLAADVVIIWLLMSHESTRRLGKLWAAYLSMAVMFANLILIAALFVPLLSVFHSLT